ncbi:primosomal protein N' [Halanaerobacter jeridensis]|uniref:Replication restart protein PriA n=1 Tax=Halanaerobacter jeridensis TaxID=706427 RepID=A0A938XSJ1_9FIRM|nr:primosomal protein N' [Halanaerobacter jeridensis]MBM7555506.1 primosomal protein N' (replication factor Y) [Halanaerobacter jeridensis]
MGEYISVIVDLPVKQVNKEFTYHVPEEWQDSVHLGRKVIVPFGNQKKDGYVIAKKDKAEVETKDILEVADDIVYFNQELLQVAQWMAEYYQCYLITAIKAVIPSGDLKIKTKRVVELAQSKSATKQKINELKNRAPKQAEVLRYLVDHKADLITTELANKVDTSSGTIRRLADRGLVIYEKKEVKRDPYQNLDFDESNNLDLTSEQEQALNSIMEAVNNNQSQTFLLKGVTGSGKTEVYLQAIDQVLEQGQGAIVLVPEISLTPQTITRFKGRFQEQVAVLHSQLSSGERFDEWRRIKNGEAKIVIGARSAIFAPLSDLGLIIIDEEHETTYKQDDHPKYHAREVAIYRAGLKQAATVLGTATPSLEAYYRTQNEDYQLLELHNRIDDRPMPEVEVVDMREELNRGNRTMFSELLQEEITTRLEEEEQAIVFLNRRGFSTFVQCRKCGYVMRCEDCDVSLTYHSNPPLLHCHYCDHKEKVPDNCPECGSKYIKYFGVGTQKVEEQLNELFPEANIKRMDVDTTRKKGAYRRILSDFKEHKIDILVGTQMVAKGHDFPNVTLVGVVTADTALNFPDFRSSERTFQLLTQVAGRTGRGDKGGEVVVQSYTPEHYSIQLAKEHDYKSFYEQEIASREATSYPPFSKLINFLVSAEDEDKVIKNAHKLGELVRGKIEILENNEIQVLGPVQAPLSKLQGKFRWQLIIKGQELDLLREISDYAVTELRDMSISENVKVSVDVDPLRML